MVGIGVYFLSDVEHKYLLHQLLPVAREVGVNKELRGWSWFQPPLKPYYEDVKLPMYTVTSKYCPTGRDVYLRSVEKIRPKPTANVALGKMFHGVVSMHAACMPGVSLCSFLFETTLSGLAGWRGRRMTST